MDLRAEFSHIADELTRLFKDELKRQKLVETGKLYNSIQWVAKETSQGFTLEMKAEDYFKYVDDKYHITKEVFGSIGFRSIESRIAQAYTNQITQDIDLP